MVDKIPTSRTQALCKCKLLYLGTSIHSSILAPTKSASTAAPDPSNSQISLNILQKTIATRYPIDGDKYARGIETWLNIYSNGIKMEHQPLNEQSSKHTSFFYPIKSLIYCGALRFTQANEQKKQWRFMPLDSDVAQHEQNLKYPPMFVCVLKSFDFQKIEKIECHTYVAGTKKSAMKLVESCQQAYNTCVDSLDEFMKNFNCIPAVFSTDNKYIANSLNIRSMDTNGYFYTLDESLIDYWQLFEKDDNKDIKQNLVIEKNNDSAQQKNEVSINESNQTKNVSEKIYECDYEEIKEVAVESKPDEDPILIDPYTPHPNLVKVEKRYDPESGQNIYVRWLSLDPQPNTPSSSSSPATQPQEDSDITLEIPILMEKVSQKNKVKKKPSMIVKEIHYDEEPDPKIIEIIREVETNSDRSLPKRSHKKSHEHRKSHRSLSRRALPKERVYVREREVPMYFQRRHIDRKTLDHSRLRNVSTRHHIQEDPYYRVSVPQHDYARVRKGLRSSKDYEKAYDLIDNIEYMIDSTKRPIGKDRRIYVVHEKEPSARFKSQLREQSKNRKIVVMEDGRKDNHRSRYADDLYATRRVMNGFGNYYNYPIASRYASHHATPHYPYGY